MLVTPTSRAALADEIVELVAARPGRVRLVLDGPAPARPGELAAAVATALRARGRATVVVDAADFLRPASVRLEQGRTDPDALLDRWLDEAALRREVLDPAAPDGSAGCCRGCGTPAPTGPTAPTTPRSPPTGWCCCTARCCWVPGTGTAYRPTSRCTSG